MTNAERTSAAEFDHRGKPNVQRLLTPAERHHVEELVTQLIDLLDETDADPDAEPSPGWSTMSATTVLDRQGLTADLEEEHDGREPDGDFEPWIVPLFGAAPAAV